MMATLLHDLLRDLKHALRMLAMNPGFTAVAVLTLAMGIGAATTMFSFIEGAILDPFPYADSHRLALVVLRNPAWGTTDYYWGWFPVQDFLEFRKHNTVFDNVVGTRHQSCVLAGLDTPVAFDSLEATGNFFQMAGVPPLAGRTFTPADAVPGAPPVAVLRYSTWQSRFGGDPNIVGRTLILSGRPRTVIGVMPPRFGWQNADLWIPETFTSGGGTDQDNYVSSVAHLKRGVSIEQAAAQVAVLFKGFAARDPKAHPQGLEFSVKLLSAAAVGPQPHRIFFILFGAVGLLFGIGCLNVANLLLARATTRETETAIRASLGAGRWRLVRQFMAESLLLGASGALLGCLFAWLGLKAVLAVVPTSEIPVEAVIRINGPVLLFTGMVTILGTLLFGLAPAFHAVGRDIQTPLRSSGRGVGESRRQSRLRELLVVSEVTLSLVLLTGAGLLMRGFMAARYANLGYDPHNLLFAWFMLPESRYKTPDQRNLFSNEVLRHLRTMPAVVSVAYGFMGGAVMPVEMRGKPSEENARAQVQIAGDGYFATLHIPVLEGRAISEEDFKLARNVAVINRLFATRYLPGEGPLGREVTVKGMAKPPYSVKSPSFEIVGVVGDVRISGYDDPPQPTLYVPSFGGTFSWSSFLIRTATAPGLLLNPLRREIATLDKELPVAAEPFEDMMNQWAAEPRFVATLMSVFAALGLTLVLVGVYGVLSYSATQRTREIGIRMALGAQVGDVLRLLLTSGLRWLLIGIGLGVPASIGLARALRNRIWGLKAADPLTLVIVAILLTTAGLVACYIPARRATKVDPMVALRYE